jgi:hypothetical protein
MNSKKEVRIITERRCDRRYYDVGSKDQFLRLIPIAVTVAMNFGP